MWAMTSSLTLCHLANIWECREKSEVVCKSIKRPSKDLWRAIKSGALFSSVWPSLGVKAVMLLVDCLHSEFTRGGECFQSKSKTRQLEFYLSQSYKSTLHIFLLKIRGCSCHSLRWHNACAKNKHLRFLCVIALTEHIPLWFYPKHV